MVDRRNYMDWLIAFQEKRLIKVVTGIRRCGKSTLFEMFQGHLRSQGVPPDRIVAVNLEDLDSYGLRDPHALHAFVKERIKPDGTTFVFLDEIQHVRDYADAVDSLYIRPGVDLYLTGSNAHFLSGEIATSLSGRYVELRMLPLSLKEYRDFTHGGSDLNQLYLDYLRFSSFPYAAELGKDPDAVGIYLDGLFSTVVLKDIAARNRTFEYPKLERVIRFLFDNVGNLCSPKRIGDVLGSEGSPVSQHTIETYLDSLQESFVLYRADRYDIRGLAHLKSLAKYYAVDMALRSRLLGIRGADAGRVLENVVYLELLRRGYKVYVGKVDDLEVDFVAMKAGGLHYVQVAATVRDVQTLERELKPLRRIRDSYPKTLLTLDFDPDQDFEGILKRNALEWLLGDAM